MTDQIKDLDNKYKLLTDENKSLKIQLDKSKASLLS